ncbi:MAG: cation diffusion facilitator family transporter [Micrococcales bacterium]|nr:cation diffusion facilitator family transporter [Micrococcales bacterium]MCL2667967.1 cation diffusion facilitator family transporter [Micrococcales bacterium]
MSHDHHTPGHAHRGRLVIVLVITGTVMVVQAVGGLVSGSVALLADAGHMLTDVGGLALALVAMSLAARPATSVRTFGWQRVEVLAAMANAMVVAAVGIGVLVEGARRLAEPRPVTASVMLAVALVGLAANAVGLALLRRGQAESLNVRGAYLEVLGDLLGSVAVVVAAVVVATTGFVRADALASIAIGMLIVPRAYGLLRQVGRVLLEATPEGIDLDEVRRHLCGVPGVIAVHDLHAWTITSGVPVLSAHVVVADDTVTCGDTPGILDALHTCLRGHFDVDHCTFQLEPVGHAAHEGHTHM